MSDSRNIEEERPSGIHVRVRSFASPKIAELLNATVFGTEGKLRYRQKDIVQRIKSQRNIEFIEVQKGVRALGTAGVIHRPAIMGKTVLNTFFVRYLSVASAFNKKKNTRVGFSGLNHPKKRDRPGRLHTVIGQQITEHFEQPFIENMKEGAFYAYVESQNKNSHNLCTSMGFEPIRKVNTLLFSRFSPKQSKQVVNPSENDQTVIQNKLRAFYNTHSFYFEDQIFDTGFYLVKKMNGQIVAGIRATPVYWQLVEYPGLAGWLMKEILPFLPFTKRLFKPGELAFLAFDYLFYNEDEEAAATELMSHACALLNFHMGMIWGDAESPHSSMLKHKYLGFMNSMVGPVSADLMVRPINVKHNILNNIKEVPVFVSALDMT